MKFQNSIIVSALISFVCAAPHVEGRDDKAVVPSYSKHLESESTNFENVGYVPRSVLRKREVEAGNKTEEAVNKLYGNLDSTYYENLDWRKLDIRMVDLVKEFEKVQEIAKTAKDGVLKEKVVYMEQMIEAYKEIVEMEKKFDGCDYPGSDFVINILDFKVYALTAGNIQGQNRAVKIVEIETHLQSNEEDGVAAKEKMVPGLAKMFAAQIEKVKEIIKDLKEDKSVEKDPNSEVDAAHDDKKTCPEIK
ncbi:hypothetical protein OY671_003268 [Metschnikowia pulcherrima]|nr:hypothetical protein OY671_003268 [Metschnikowia pulcherrima]